MLLLEKVSTQFQNDWEVGHRLCPQDRGPGAEAACPGPAGRLREHTVYLESELDQCIHKRKQSGITRKQVEQIPRCTMNEAPKLFFIITSRR